jgi:DNA-directed RNA polymerase specialized sigma24 family protein
MAEAKPFFRPRLAFSRGADPKASARAAEAERTRQFRETILPHMDGAYNFARYLSRDPVAAEDIVQEAFLRAFRAFGNFRGGAPKAWLFAIVRNCFLDWAAGRTGQDRPGPGAGGRGRLVPEPGEGPGQHRRPRPGRS